MFKIAAILVLELLFIKATAQNYHAIQGSPYAGSLGVHNNPASAVSVPYGWDLTIFGIQGKSSTNAIKVYKYSIFSSPKNSEYLFTDGLFKRYGDLSANLNLLNARISLDRKNAISFGMNLRSISNVNTTKYYFIDTPQTMLNFLNQNEQNQPLGLRTVTTSWVEFYASYARTIIDNEVGRLNAGVTVRLSRGLSGAHGSLEDGRYRRITSPDPANYTIEGGALRYGYSSNFDRWSDNASQSENIRNFIRATEGGASLDFGVEWFVKTQEPSSFGYDNYYDYDWKFGLSLLDLGVNQYKYGLESRYATNILPGTTDLTIAQKFDSTTAHLPTFNDSLATIVSTFAALNGQFRIHNPTRFVLNVDRYIYDAFFINAELNIQFANALKGKTRFAVKEINLLTIVPRWETRKLGFYLPFHVNNNGKLWVGGAVKAGPVLIGWHNWGYFFSKQSIQNGGLYLAVTIRPADLMKSKYEKGLDCPRIR
jgi:hypothetical protein